LLINAVEIAGLVSAPAANWIGERSGLNDALLALLSESDKKRGLGGPYDRLAREFSARPLIPLYQEELNRAQCGCW
jgi:hypothetical protein